MSDNLAEDIARKALRVDWWDTETAARRVAEYAADRIEELEAKLAQQDDLVQVAVERGFWLGRSCGGSKAEIDAALAAIREGGE